MSKSVIFSYGSVQQPEPLTRRTYFGGSFVLGAGATDNIYEAPVREAGVMSNLFVRVSTNGVSANTVVTLVKSTVDTAITVTYASDQTGIKEDLSNSVSFANTDEANYKMVTSSDAGTPEIDFRMIGIQFAPTDSTKCVSFFNCGALTTISTSAASTSYFFVPNGHFDAALTTENFAKFRIRNASVAQNFLVHVINNARTTDTTFATRIDGGDGAQTVTYTSTQTGVKEDITNTDTLAVGNDFNYRETTGTGTDTMDLGKVSCNLVTTDNRFFLLSGSNFGDAVNFNSTFAGSVSGRLLHAGSASEALTGFYSRFTFKATELGFYVSANTIATSATVVTLRDNFVNSSLTVSYAAAQTGLKNDSTNSAILSSGSDEINYRIATPNTSGSITPRWASVVGVEFADTQMPRLLLMGVG